MAGTEIRDAASVLLVRERPSGPEVLVGKRSGSAVFMPNKFVFPGGAVSPEDSGVKLAGTPCGTCMSRLAAGADPDLAASLVACAIREVHEETGLMLGERLTSRDAVASCSGWEAFANAGMAPSGARLVFFFRAVTPPGLPRRFDARFLLGRVGQVSLAGNPDDLSSPSSELAELQWVAARDAPRLDLPYISRLVLKAALEALDSELPPLRVPFHFTENGERRLEYI